MFHPWARAAVRAAAGLFLAGALAEALARLVSPPLAPSDYLVPEPDDERFHSSAGPHPYLAGGLPATLYDPRLLWALNPHLGPGTLHAPSRRAIISERGREGRVVAALGDGFTRGPLAPRIGWPDMLQELVDMNRSHDGVHVVNAAVPGYSSLQGLLWYRQREDLRADVVVLGFGADDARPVQRTDASSLARVRRAQEWGRSRALATLLRWAWSLEPPRPATRRVPLDRYADHLRELVWLARQRGARPVLLTRPYRRGERLPEPVAALPRYNAVVRVVAAETTTPCLDLDAEVAGDATFFVDAIRPSPAGLRRVAETVLRHLRSLRLVDTEHRFESGGALAEWGDARPELRGGFWQAEPWAGREPGRWTAAEARMVLERRAREGGLLVDFTLENPGNRTSGRIEVGGRTLLRFAERNRRLVRILDIRGIDGPVVEVRFVTDGAAPRPPASNGRPDPRVLGVFVHRVALVPSHLATGLDLASVDDERPELAAGWFGAEAWADGRRGRWTGARADLRLGRPPGHDLLLVDVSLESPRGETHGSLDVNGRQVERFDGGNGPRRLRIDLRDIPGDELSLRFAVKRTFLPGRGSGATDDRRLGVFVHAVRVAPAEEQGSVIGP